MPGLTFTDSPTVPKRGRKRIPIPSALMDAVKDSAERGVAKSFTGSEDEVSEIMTYLNRLRRQGEYSIETGRELLEDGIKLAFRAVKNSD